MIYEEVKEILNAKNNIPYPVLMNIRKNPKYAQLLYNSFASNKGELNAVTQYIYEHIEFKRFNDFAHIILDIAIEEMHHLDLIGDLIVKLGNKPYYINSNKCFWNSKNIKYQFTSIYDMLTFNIESEKKAILEYETIIKYTQNKSIKALLERIILDEKTHLEIFNRLR